MGAPRKYVPHKNIAEDSSHMVFTSVMFYLLKKSYIPTQSRRVGGLNPTSQWKEVKDSKSYLKTSTLEPSKMLHQIRVLAIECDNLSLFSRTHTVARENQLWKAVL